MARINCNDKWLNTNEATARKKIISYSKIRELKNLRKCLCNSKSKWENQMEKVVQILDAVTRNYHKQKCFCVE